MLLGLIHLIGRDLYARAYRNKGPGARGPGFGMVFLSNFALTCSAIFGGIKLTGHL